MSDYDAIIIGAGHNGLTCACYLARAGMRTLVVEASDEIGGMTTTRELVMPGFWTDVHASGYQLANLSSAMDELDLASFGLALIRPDVSLSKVLPDQRCLSIRASLDDSCASIAAFSPADAQRWRSLFAGYLAQKDQLRQELESSPPLPGEQLASLAQGANGQQHLRFHFQSVRSWASEQFVSDAMRDLMADFAAHAGFAPDDAGGAAFALLFLSVIQDLGNRVVRGGMGQLPAALAACLRHHGGEIRAGSPVSRIMVEQGAATGVVLENGEQIRASRVASSAHPIHLIQHLLKDASLEQGIAEAIDDYEPGVSQMGIYLALSGPVTYLAGGEAATATQVHLMPSNTDALAEVFRHIRSDQLPDQPSLFIVNEATLEPSRVPPGKSSLKIILTTVPYAVDWAAERERYAHHVIDQITRTYIPDLRDKIIGAAIMSPVDYERDLLSAIQGTVTHGAMTLYQQGSMRPMLQLGQFRGPVDRLYLCGAGSYPGPGVSMMPGRNAARVVLGESQKSGGDS